MVLSLNHHSITSAQEVNTIAQPLFRSTCFDYFSFFHERTDGSRLILSTNPDWTYFLYNQSYASITEFNPRLNKSDTNNTDKTGDFLWEWLPNLLPTNQLRSEFFKKIQDSRQFSINSGISIIKKVGDGYEYFNFGTALPASYIYTFYFNHIDILRRFVVYFKLKSTAIMEVGNKNRILLTTDMSATPTASPMYNHDSILSFLNETIIKEYPVTYNHMHEKLSHRQLQCLLHLSHGLSSKEVGCRLNISYRTVEKYYQLIKESFGLNTKSDLLRLAATEQVQEYIAYEKATESYANANQDDNYDQKWRGQ